MLIFWKKAELHYNGRLGWIVDCGNIVELHHVRAILKFLSGCSKELQRPKLKMTMEVDGIHSFPSKRIMLYCQKSFLHPRSKYTKM